MEVENLDDQNISATKPKNKIQTENELNKNLKQSSTSYPKCAKKVKEDWLLGIGLERLLFERSSVSRHHKFPIFLGMFPIKWFEWQVHYT